MQVQIARVKSERAEAALKASYHYQQQLLHEEQWIQLECFGLQVITMTTFIVLEYPTREVYPIITIILHHNNQLTHQLVITGYYGCYGNAK